MNTLQPRVFEHCLHGIPTYIIPFARQGQHVRTTRNSIDVETKSTELENG